ncbi:HIRAN domain-containing protein [Sphingomonas sp. MG17]|uniref:HIRAN domain-containing protein n=1 Tax=Sphingomonas tagetis TaxID=2949092 RepID=A0A9X2HR02_9SPHN|nr:HIRAN domain-containing protein [Sphingomonas tagetis]MCP3731989.1 HIRAN domain-containing protein [Sphingomonas tagetis]
MDERELSLAVVGLDFPNKGKPKGNRRFEMLACRPGEPVELRLEPKNPADPNAIAVFSIRGIQLGYLTAERAPWIGSKIRNGEPFEVLFQEPSATAAWIRIRFGGGAPTLRPARPMPPPPDDFPPDAEPPDDFNQDQGGW